MKDVRQEFDDLSLAERAEVVPPIFIPSVKTKVFKARGRDLGTSLCQKFFSVM